MAERTYFNLSEHESIEFQLDDGFEIIYSSPHSYVAITLDAAHVRAFIRCMAEALPELEACERLGEDVDLINGRGNLNEKKMPSVE